MIVGVAVVGGELVEDAVGISALNAAGAYSYITWVGVDYCTFVGFEPVYAALVEGMYGGITKNLLW